MMLDGSLTTLKGVGEAQAKKFAVLGIKTIADLVTYYPRRYDDYSVTTPVGKLRPGKVTVQVTISQVSGRYVRRGMHITEAIGTDASGSVRLVWFNQPYRAASLKSGTAYYVSGEFALRQQHFSITNPNLEQASDVPLNTGRILAVYRETKGLTSRQIRLAVAEAVPHIKVLPESLPSWLVKEYDLLSLSQALQAIHQPQTADDLSAARRRLGFEEVFRLVLASLLNKAENQVEPAVVIPFNKALAQQFVEHVPFKLTDGQRRTVWKIYQDLQRPHPMNRLVEGDVGSGKTVVAAMAAVMALAQQYQVALMAPTELLARQHADTLHALLEPLGMHQQIVLLVGSMSSAQKQRARQAIKEGKAGLLIGTQALIQDSVDMHKLALVVIDEQHRFGVEQRKALMAKAGHMPHVLSLTATPIPRSLALVVYGELDVSVLAEKPKQRQPVTTELVSPNSTKQLFAAVDAELEAGRQMFVVCPLITDSDSLAASSAESVHAQLSKHEFKHRRVGLLHGKLKPADKQAIMQAFVDHELDILVSTTVIEVGVDVPNASIMMVQDAERFGLAQLHQLRGRVGRGEHPGFCYLLLSDSKSPSPRLRALERSNDGFKLAELDLELRGPGAIYGVSQHGQLDLRIAELSDVRLTSQAREAAQAFIDKREDLLQYSQLAAAVQRLRAVTNLN